MREFLLGVGASLLAAAVIGLGRRLALLGGRLRFRAFLRAVSQLRNRIEADSTFHPQAVVAQSRSGAIAGGILAGVLRNLELRSPLVVGLTLERCDGRRVTSLAGHRPDVRGLNRVLVVACVNDSGEGLIEVSKWLHEELPDADIRTAAVYSNAKSVLTPTYVGVEVGGRRQIHVDRLLTKMPWMVPGWFHDLPAERGMVPN